MSEENVELVLHAFRLVETDDYELWAELWHLDARATSPEGWPEQGPFAGRDAIVGQFQRLTSDWEEHHFEDIELIADSGEWVVFSYAWCARGVASGIPTRFEMAVANRVVDGRLQEAHFRWDRQQALDAAGLSA